MKGIRFILICISLLPFLNCDGDYSESNSVSSIMDSSSSSGANGTLTVSISGCSTFNGHSLYYSIYDSDDSDFMVPTGNVVGMGCINVANGSGSVLTKVSKTDSTAATLAAGTWYLRGLVDMNDNFEDTEDIDRGDYYITFIEVTIDGDSIYQLRESDFSRYIF